MPETAIHEYGYFTARPSEVRLTGYWPMLPVTPDPCHPEEFRKRQFGSGVAARVYRGHDPPPMRLNVIDPLNG
jgi:hypothetical protein